MSGSFEGKPSVPTRVEEAAPSPEVVAHKVGDVLSNVAFETNPRRPDVFFNSTPGRKRIRVTGGAFPQPGKDYDVTITEDTDPGNPLKGEYLVDIAETDEHLRWTKVDDKVSATEPVLRQARRASSELYLKSPMEDEALSSAQMRVLSHSKIEAEAYRSEAEKMLGDEDSPERQLSSLRRETLASAVRDELSLEYRALKLAEEEGEILRTMNDVPTGAEMSALREIREERKEIQHAHAELLQSSPEAYYGLHLRTLKGYKKDLDAGTIVEIPYVQEKIADITTHARAGKPVLVFGHLGSGKTELLMHTARTHMGKEALVLSGSKDMSLSEIYGHQILRLGQEEQVETADLITAVETEFNEWNSLHTGATEEEKDRIHTTIRETLLAQLKTGTVSDFFLGPVYRAMEEGRPLIIDEVNAIPHEVLISLNHILTRRPGDTVNVQQNSGRQILVKEGFCVFMTGNLNQGQDRYIGRQDMDPAFLSRLYKVEYDYPPQKIEGSLEDEAGEENELFHILLAKVMDRNGNIEVPENSMRKLWNLAKVARASQDIFSGRDLGKSFYFRQAGSRPTPYYLRESVLSLRALDAVISQWQKEGYRYELDHYLWEEFINQSTSPEDKAFLYQMCKDRFGLFSPLEGWPQTPNYGQAGMVNSFSVKSPKTQTEAKEFFGPRDTVNFAFGKNAPSRETWPEKRNT